MVGVIRVDRKAMVSCLGCLEVRTGPDLLEAAVGEFADDVGQDLGDRLEGVSPSDRHLDRRPRILPVMHRQRRENPLHIPYTYTFTYT